MKSTRKLLAAILAVAMLFSIAVTAVSATVSADVQGTKYEEAADVLGALKIMVGDKDTGAFRPDDNLKRSEFAKIAVSALGLGDVAQSNAQATKFPDVAADHWATGYINVAVNQAIIIGDDNGNFRPDDKITYAEACTVLVRLLGHEPAAKAKGGYPTGYLVTGAETGVTKDVAAAGSSAVTRGMIARMTFNSLTVKLMEQTGFGSDIKYEVVDKTLLNDKLDTENLKGQVTATADSRLTGTSSLPTDEVEIGGVVYKTGDVKATDLLGFNVDFYVKKDSNTDDKILILARIDSSRNSYMTVVADNIDQIMTGSEKGVKYWVDKDKDTSTKTVYFDTGATMMYNGKAATWNDNLLKPASGKIVMLDTNRNDKYDMVFVTSFENYVVDGTSALSHSVTDKYGKTALVLDPDNKDIRFSIEKDGKTFKFEDLKEWDVLSVTKSLDGNLIRAIVVNDKAEGKVEEKDSEHVTISGKEYKIAANYTTDINIGDTGVYYLDADGKIAAVDTMGNKNGNYAYLVDAGSTGTISNEVQFKLFTKAGETKVLSAAEKVKLDNSTSAINAEDALAQIKPNGVIVPQIITYAVNSDNKINEITRAADHTATLDYYRSEFAKNFAANDVVYKSASSKLGVFGITDKTIIFDIPTGKTDPEDFAIRNNTMFVDKSKYNIQVFDMQEDMTASAILVTNSSGNTSAETPIAVVDKITKVKNADGNDVDKLYALQGGKAMNINTESTGILVKSGNLVLQQGDIIQYKTNVKGEIDGITVLFDVSTKATQATATPSEDLATVYGQVQKTFPRSINVTVNGGNLNNYTTDKVTVYNYDSSKSSNQVTVASAADISKYDPADSKYIFIRIYKDEVKEMVIVE